MIAIILSCVLTLNGMRIWCEQTRLFVKKARLTYFLFVNLSTELATEKAQQAVLKGVEHFDPSQLKHAETQEKIVLPDAEGKPRE